MEQKRQKVMEQLRRIAIGAAGEKTHTMNGNEIVEIACSAVELLEADAAQTNSLQTRFRIEVKNEDGSVDRIETNSAAVVVETEGGSRNLLSVDGNTITATILYLGMQELCRDIESEDKFVKTIYETIKDKYSSTSREKVRFPGHGEPYKES